MIGKSLFRLTHGVVRHRAAQLFGHHAFLTVNSKNSMIECVHMSQKDIVCKATLDTFVRFGIVIAALLGFAVYFFYDGHIGYAKQNEAICSYRAFAQLGSTAAQHTAAGWETMLGEQALIPTTEENGQTFAVGEKDSRYPLPAHCEAARSCPPEARDHATMSRSWSDCWAAYSKRMHYPLKPGDHPHDEGAIREQWYAGVAFTITGIILLGLALRTHKRELSLRGTTVTAAGRSFDIRDIECIDLRQWGTGFKGIAYLTVGGKRVRFDGMTYGGFNKEKGEPAEALMQAILSQYKGDIIEYETTSAQNS